MVIIESSISNIFYHLNSILFILYIQYCFALNRQTAKFYRHKDKYKSIGEFS